MVFKDLTCFHLEGLLREPLKEYLQNEGEYIRTFDRFEYLFALVYADINESFTKGYSLRLAVFNGEIGMSPRNI